MRRLLPLLALLLVAPAAAEAAVKRPCGPAAATTLAAGPQARVLRSGGRTSVCARGSRPVRVGRAKPGLVRITGTTVLLVDAREARSVDAATGRVLRRLGTPAGTARTAVLLGGGAFAVQVDEAIVKADADWPRRQVLTRDAAPLTLARGARRQDLVWTLPGAGAPGRALLADRVARCDASRLATDGGFTLGQLFDQVVMCPTGRPRRTRLILDTSFDTGSLDAGPGYTLVGFRAGTAVMRSSLKDRTGSEVETGLAVLRHDRPANPVEIATSGASDFGGGPIERALLDPQGRAVLAVRRGFSAGGAVPDAFVLAVTAAGDRPLDAGPGVDPASLALTGSVATWTRDGVPQAFDLAGA